MEPAFQTILNNAGSLPGVKIGDSRFAGPPQEMETTERFKKTGLPLTSKVWRYPDGTEFGKSKDITVVLPGQPAPIPDQKGGFFEGYLISNQNPNVVAGRTDKGRLRLIMFEKK